MATFSIENDKLIINDGGADKVIPMRNIKGTEFAPLQGIWFPKSPDRPHDLYIRLENDEKVKIVVGNHLEQIRLCRIIKEWWGENKGKVELENIGRNIIAGVQGAMAKNASIEDVGKMLRRQHEKPKGVLSRLMTGNWGNLGRDADVEPQEERGELGAHPQEAKGVGRVATLNIDVRKAVGEDDIPFVGRLPDPPQERTEYHLQPRVDVGYVKVSGNRIEVSTGLTGMLFVVAEGRSLRFASYGRDSIDNPDTTSLGDLVYMQGSEEINRLKDVPCLLAARAVSNWGDAMAANNYFVKRKTAFEPETAKGSDFFITADGDHLKVIENNLSYNFNMEHIEDITLTVSGKKGERIASVLYYGGGTQGWTMGVADAEYLKSLFRDWQSNYKWSGRFKEEKAYRVGDALVIQHDENRYIFHLDTIEMVSTRPTADKRGNVELIVSFQIAPSKHFTLPEPVGEAVLSIYDDYTLNGSAFEKNGEDLSTRPTEVARPVGVGSEPFARLEGNFLILNTTDEYSEIDLRGIDSVTARGSDGDKKRRLQILYDDNHCSMTELTLPGQVSKDAQDAFHLWQATPREVAPTGFQKNDKGKAPMHLLPAGSTEEMAYAMEVGAVRYGINNFLEACTPEDIERYIAALMRHTEAFRKGRRTDADSKLRHLAHIMANAGILIALEDLHGGDAFPKPPKRGRTK